MQSSLVYVLSVRVPCFGRMTDPLRLC